MKDGDVLFSQQDEQQMHVDWAVNLKLDDIMSTLAHVKDHHVFWEESKMHVGTSWKRTFSILQLQPFLNYGFLLKFSVLKYIKFSLIQGIRAVLFLSGELSSSWHYTIIVHGMCGVQDDPDQE